MSLSTRLSLFFMTALALVLLGFSAALYTLSKSDLSRHLDMHLEKSLDTLEAAVDVETGGLEWEPMDRRLTLGIDPGIEHVRWAVQDGDGNFLDRSPNAQDGRFPPPGVNDVLRQMPADATAVGELPGWRLGRRHLRLDELLKMGRGHSEDDDPGDDVEYEELILTVGLSPEPIEDSLHRLALALVGISTTLWLLFAVLGRRLARRALAPVVKLAEAARELTVSDHGGNLPSTGTGDELEDLSRAFNELLARRHEALERQSRFSGDASHQLRTPLAGLLSLVEVIRRRPRSAEEYEQTLDQVHREATRLRQIVDALLFLARSEDEAAAPEGEPIDLTRWTAEQLSRWSTHPRAADIHHEPAAEPVWVRAHPSLLGQVLENLVDNAMKYSEPGTPITISQRREGRESSLTVADRGCGLSAEEARSVFEPFYRSPRSRQTGRAGFGLGLAIVQRILTALGGTVTVESTPGRGSRFVLRLPALDRDEAGEPSLVLQASAQGQPD
jgi:signal transduction histidine kinase